MAKKINQFPKFILPFFKLFSKSKYGSIENIAAADPQEEKMEEDNRVKTVAMRIVNVFETGKADGEYGALVVLKDGACISFGRSQVTDGSNSLDLLIDQYIDAGGIYAEELRPYVVHLADPLMPLSKDAAFKELLKKTATDPIMRQVQDDFFDKRYWEPARKKCESMGLVEPLSLAIVYDSYIHSGGLLSSIRRTFPEVPPAKGGDERAWTTAYVWARRSWLANYRKKVVRGTVYRMDTYQQLIDDDNWNLDTPVVAIVGRSKVDVV